MLRGFLAIAVVFFSGTLVSADDPTPPPPISIAGAPIDPLAPAETEIARVTGAWLAERVTLAGPNLRLSHSRAWFGARVDTERLARWIREAHDPTSPLRAVHDRLHAGAALDLPLPVRLDDARLFELLVNLKDEEDRRPTDARFDTASHEVIPHARGVQVDVWATLERFEEEIERGAREIEVVARLTEPEITSDRLAGIDTTVLLGSFETRYNTSEDARDRTFNLRVAAQRIDGRVVFPGEEFDFNRVVGERNEANGFRVAPVIAAGELVDGIGGGTCQISGTLHSAVFFSGLPILERRPHSRPSFYIKLGLDAAVSYPSLNFRFKNDLDFPVVLGLRVEEGWVRASVRGREHHRQVSFVRRIDDAMAFETRVVEDSELPAGVRVLQQRGVPGFRIKRWRIVRDMRLNQAVREAMADVYPPTTEIWRVGTGGPAPDEYVPPPGDTHPEYTADEYLSMTQGDGVVGTLESRAAGCCGLPGWTVRAGFTESVPDRAAGE
jgi:vancomycin resistance protein YoaR